MLADQLESGEVQKNEYIEFLEDAIANKVNEIN